MGRKEGWLLGLSAVLSNRHCGAFDVTQLSSFLERRGDGGPERRCDWLKVAQLSGWWQSHILTAPVPLLRPQAAPQITVHVQFQLPSLVLVPFLCLLVDVGVGESCHVL